MQLSLGLFLCFGSAVLQAGFMPYHDKHENCFAFVVELNLYVVVFVVILDQKIKEEYMEGPEGYAISLFLVILEDMSVRVQLEDQVAAVSDQQHHRRSARHLR